MTAFARQERPVQSGVLSCEIKTVNRRYLDISVRAAEPIRALEAVVIKAIQGKLARGRVECLFNLQADDAGMQPRVDLEALAALMGEMRKTEDKLRDTGLEPASASALEVMQWSGVTGRPEPDVEQLRKDAMELLGTTLDSLVASRREEGARLEQFIFGHCTELEKTVSQLRAHYPQALKAACEKLEQRLAETIAEITEPDRLAHEAALLAQKFCIGADIEEELNRCDSHIEELKAVFRRAEPTGKRLDFLMQELNREVNTISSKSADIKTTHAAVEAKTLIEQMREQVQNIE